jgi:hypothetical protein
MLKLLSIDSSFFDEPVIRTLNLEDKRGLVKSAADNRISDFARTLTPDPGKVYVHILAMGAGEYFGANRNADYFPEDNLKACYETFETSPAHIFQHHINKDPNIAIGKVIYAVYNERMHRVEVVAWIDRTKGASIVEKIDRGQFPATSMACHTPFDTCSICGNKARSRSQYCSHLKDQLGVILPDGRKVMAINDGPLKFFDMSVVFRPADVTSSVLQKLANDQGVKEKSPEEIAISSVDAAAASELQEKAASMKKVSELIKEVEGTITAAGPSVQALLDKVKDPGDDVLDLLVQFDLHHVLHALAELGISPSVGFFAKLVGQKISGGKVAGIERLVSGLLREDPDKVVVPEGGGSMTKAAEVGSSYGAKTSLLSALTPFVKQASLFPSMAMARATDTPLTPEQLMFPTGEGVFPTGNRGYIGGNNGDPRIAYRALKDAQHADGPGLLKTLFLVGGAAIAAKWLLSRLIEEKLREQNANMRAHSAGPVKIVLVKSAEEALATRQLVRASLLRGLQGF